VSPATRTDYLHQLFLLNLCLQIFDGIATWHGVSRWGEGNPLLATLMPTIGAGATLLFYKANSCGLLVLLRRLGHYGSPLVKDAFVVLATVYGALSFVPWMCRLVTLVVV
jgi:hypothetical protein